jgi:hypothetical protein
MKIDGLPAAPAREHRLGAYSIWQLRDFLIEKGIATVLVLGLFGYLSIWPAFMMTRRAGQSIESLGPVVDQMTVALLGQLVFIGALFAINGIVAEDRKQGYYRFYFSKPVTVPAFYAQKLAMHLLGFLAAAAVLIGAYSYFVRPFSPPMLFPVLAVTFLGVAGIGFLISALWRYDLMTLIAVYFAANLGWQLFGNDPGWKGRAVYALPPLHRLEDIFQPLVLGGDLPVSLVAWIAGYGAACVILGLLVIRRKPLSSP